MPFHLELGSDGHSFNGKAIVVNSITGRHFSHNPIPMEKAKAQKRVVEEAVAEHGEHVTASGKPDARKKKMKASAPPSKCHPMDKAMRVPMSAAEAKKVAQQAKEAGKEAKRQRDELEPKISKLSNLERKLMDAIAGANTVKHVGSVVSSPSDMVKDIVMSHYDKSAFGKDAESKEHTHFRSKINHILKYLNKVDNADHKIIHDMLKD